MFCLDNSFNAPFFTQTQIKKSKFVAYIFRYSQSQNIKDIIQEIKPFHQKARHFVYASRHLNKYNQIVEASSDDGEPKNSSAPSLLNSIRGEDLINIAVIVVRYFGGIKLGIGGLVRAYAVACASVIQESKDKNLFITYQKLMYYIFVVDYKNLSKIQYELNKNSLLTVKKDFLNNDVKIEIEGIQENVDIFIKQNKVYIGEIS